jgi:hypothetical protein
MSTTWKWPLLALALHGGVFAADATDGQQAQAEQQKIMRLAKPANTVPAVLDSRGCFWELRENNGRMQIVHMTDARRKPVCVGSEPAAAPAAKTPPLAPPSLKKTATTKTKAATPIPSDERAHYLNGIRQFAELPYDKGWQQQVYRPTVRYTYYDSAAAPEEMREEMGGGRSRTVIRR